MACTSTTSTSTPDGGTPTADGGPGDTCNGKGTGVISLTIDGLPAGVEAKVKITGSGTPTEAKATQTLDAATAGNYTVTAERVAGVDPIVRPLFDPTIDVASFCLGDKQTQAVKITYAKLPSSNRLWVPNANNPAGGLLGFDGAALGATATVPANVAIKAPVGASVAFDKDGNLWTSGATTAETALVRYPASDLGASGTREPDRKVDFPIACGPRVSSIAFDPNGNLWVASPCLNQVIKVPATGLAATGSVTPGADDVLTGVSAPRGLAFDKTGNLWVADEDQVHFFPAARLGAGQPHTPSFSINVQEQPVAPPAPGAPIAPGALAFDKDGNLWGAFDILFKLTPADLAPPASGTTKDVAVSVRIAVDVAALLEGIAFDDAGGLWFTYSLGKVARLGPTQLGTSTNPGAPAVPGTVLTSNDMGSSANVSFFPAASNLPLYGRF